MSISFSIVICTYNGANRLSSTLEKINNLLVSEYFSFNVIIVDNNSSDNTFKSSIQLKKDYSDRLDIIVLQELNQGKVYALETALNNSTSDWIVICDDDNWLINNYLIIAYTLIKSFKDVGIFGGISQLSVDQNTIVPEWFTVNSLIYAVGEQYINSGYVTYKQNLWGAGSIVKRKCLHNCIKLVEPLLKNRGEDSEIGYRAIILGYKLYFSKNLIFEHRIDLERLNYTKHSILLNDNNISNEILKKYHLFFKYKYFSKKKYIQIIKWNLLYYISFLKLYSINNFDKSYIMINLFTKFGNDIEYATILKFYKKSLLISL
jgi:glycosyltransferase involved in cell wall biosynthesis